MINQNPGPEHDDRSDVEAVAGDGITQEAVDAAMQEAETPEDTTNEG